MDNEEKNIDIEDLQKKCEEYLNGWKRERADFLNYKKEEMERTGNLIKYANQEIILKIIPILDNMELANAHLKNDGLEQIKKQFLDILAKEGIKPIEVLGKPFDPNTMEAVGETAFGEGSGESKGETVSEEVQNGYTMHGKIIRVAKVKISK